MRIIIRVRGMKVYKVVYDWCESCQNAERDDGGYCLSCIRLTLRYHGICIPRPVGFRGGGVDGVMVVREDGS